MSVENWRMPLSLQASMTQASWTGVRLMIGYRALAGGADPIFLGLLASSFALPALLAGLPAGRLTDRLGGPVVSAAGILIAVSGILTAILISGLPVLLAASAAIGLGHLLVMVGQQTFVANVSRRGSSDGAFGTLAAAASVGQLIGPPVVTFSSSLGGSDTAPDTTLGLVVCIFFSAAAAPGYFFLRRANRVYQLERDSADGEVTRILSVLTTPGLWRSLVVSGAVLVTVDLMYAFMPVWAIDQGISVTVVGSLLALRAAVSVVSRVGLSRLIARFGRKTLIIVAIAAAAAALFALPLVGAWGAVFVMIGLGLGLGIPQPLTMAWVTALTPRSAHGATLGLRLTMNRLAQITIPLAVGALAGPLGVVGIFWANAALLLGSIVIVAGSDAGAGPSMPIDESEEDPA